MSKNLTQQKSIQKSKTITKQTTKRSSFTTAKSKDIQSSPKSVSNRNIQKKPTIQNDNKKPLISKRDSKKEIQVKTITKPNDKKSKEIKNSEKQSDKNSPNREDDTYDIGKFETFRELRENNSEAEINKSTNETQKLINAQIIREKEKYTQKINFQSPNSYNLRSNEDSINSYANLDS